MIPKKESNKRHVFYLNVTACSMELESDYQYFKQGWVLGKLLEKHAVKTAR